jgi:hypothetical protein
MSVIYLYVNCIGYEHSPVDEKLTTSKKECDELWCELRSVTITVKSDPHQIRSSFLVGLFFTS